MAEIRLRLRIRHRWWVRYFLRLAAINASMGIPVDWDRCCEIVVKHGTIYDFD